MSLVLKRPATQELLSLDHEKTALAVRALSSIAITQRTSPGSFRVRLKPGSYTDDRYGRVLIPTFPLWGNPGHTAAIPDTSVKGPLQRSIPFDPANNLFLPGKWPCRTTELHCAVRLATAGLAVLRYAPTTVTTGEMGQQSPRPTPPW